MIVWKPAYLLSQHNGVTSMAIRLPGSCLCGTIQFEVAGDPITTTYCHCESCRRWVGAPTHGGWLFQSDSVLVLSGQNNLKTYRRTATSGSHRQFCCECGSALFNDHPSIHLTDVMAGSVPSLRFEPKIHTNYRERIIDFRDGLPKYADFDPAVGGSGLLIPE